jgi:hypothetical protein
MRRGRTTTHENGRQLPLRFRERAGGEGSSATFVRLFSKEGGGMPCARPLAVRAER